MSIDLGRRSSFESGMLKRTRWKTVKEETSDFLFADRLEVATANIKKWIQECTDSKKTCGSFIEFIEDGVVLCEIIQLYSPGLIKKINRVKSRFAYWENFTFFLESCRSLGLQDWQLFDPEDVLTKRPTKHFSSTSLSPSKESSQKNLQKIVATLFWLAKALQQLPNYHGPELDLSCFNNIKSHHSSSSIGNISSTNSTPSSTPEHKSLFVSSPNSDIHNKTSPLSSSPTENNRGVTSPLLWIRNVHSTSNKDHYHTNESSYQFSHSDSIYEENSNSQYSTEEYPKESTDKLNIGVVKSQQPPPPFSANLVFVQGSTSSSILSPTSDNHHLTSAPGTHYSPHHLSNTFGTTDHIDDTGLLVDPINYHSQVFTADSGSQDSGPHFSQQSEGTFHVNLTQTSQPDNLTSSALHLEAIDHYTTPRPELPSISELTNNSPIDTFDLHHNRPHATSSLTSTSRPRVEYSCSQEYRDQYTIPTTSDTLDTNYITTVEDSTSHSYTENHLTESLDNSLSAVTLTGYVSAYSKDGPEVRNQERKLPYRRYSSPQQRNKIPRVTTVVTSHLNHTPSSPEIITVVDSDTSDTEGQEMDRLHRTSGRRQMKIVPFTNNSVEPTSDKENNKPAEIEEDQHTTTISLILLPGEKQIGFGMSKGPAGDVCVDYVTGDSPASRAGLKPRDKLLSANDVPINTSDVQDVIDLIMDQSNGQRKIILKIKRDNSFQSAIPHIDQNGYRPTDHTHLNIFNTTKLSGVDIQRVESGALPRHMMPSKIVYLDKENRHNTKQLNDSYEVLSDINSTAVEIGSSGDTGSRHTLSSYGGLDGDSRSDVNQSPSHAGGTDERSPPLPPNERSLEPTEETTHDLVREMYLNEINEIDKEEEEEDDSFRTNVGKSQSVTDIAYTSSHHQAEPSDEVSDVYIRAYLSHSNIHKKATKAESLPGKFRNIQNLHKSSSNSTGSGLGLQNMSIEDVYSASRQQMNQIWQEVETSCDLTSPLDKVDQVGDDNTSETMTDNGSLRTVRSEIPTSSNEHNIISESEHTTSPSHGLRVPVRRTSSSRSNINKGIDALLNTLRSLNEKVGTYDEEEEFKLLEEFLQSSKFRKAKEFHDNMRLLVTQGPDAPCPASIRILPQVRNLRRIMRENNDDHHRLNVEDELRRLLRKPQVQAVLFCHDKVATQDLYVPSTYFPKSAQDTEDIILYHSALDLTNHSLFVSQEAPLSRDIPSSRKENATIVYLERSNRPLGCTIYKQGDSVYVGKLLKNCDAEQSRVLREGDELLEINGVALINKSTDEIIRLMSGEAGKILAFTLIPVHDDSVDLDYDESILEYPNVKFRITQDINKILYITLILQKYVKAHFSYNGQLDEEVPCKELTLSFTKGEILEISNQDDPDWWQARKVFEDGGESLPGLIPARHLQQKREVLRESYVLSVAMEEKNKKKGILSKFSRKKKKKIYYNQGGPMSGVFQSVGHEVATYEDVVKLMPDPTRRRPIILIGAPSVGRCTLMKKLMESNPRHYGVPVRHTTRPMRSGELNGREYHFISREEMERDIQANKFLEYGENRGHLYGVSIRAVKTVIEQSKIPVLDLHPQALKVIGSSGLMPYVIFIGSPRVDRLLMTRRITSDKQKKKMHTSVSAEGLNRDVKGFTEGELLQLYHSSQEILAEYGHYLDWVIVNDDLQVATDMLLEVARRIEEEPQWVPAIWVEEV